MVEGDDDISIHNGASDFCGLEQFSAGNGNFDIISSFESVADDNLTADGIRGKSVAVSSIKVFESVFSSSRVERVAVGKKSTRLAGVQDSDDAFSVSVAEKCHVAGFSEVYFDGGEAVFERKCGDSGGADEPFKFLGEGLSEMCSHIGEVDFRRRHLNSPLGMLVVHRDNIVQTYIISNLNCPVSDIIF